jgi:hypothetical protein
MVFFIKKINMDRKIRVLCVPSDTGGCGLHRSLVPHQKLGELFGNEFDVNIKYNVDWSDLNTLSAYDIIHFHKGTYNDLENFHKALEFCKENNITTVMDVDDYWDLGQAHPLYHSYRHSNATNIIRDNLYRSDYVTTTTPIFAKKIRKFNKNVKVFVNALDENQIHRIKVENNNTSGKIRVGFVMGSTHKNDMELVRGFAEKLPKDIMDKIQIVLCGYDLRGTITEILPNGETRSRDILPEESVWFDYEKTHLSASLSLHDASRGGVLLRKHRFRVRTEQYSFRIRIRIRQRGKRSHRRDPLHGRYSGRHQSRRHDLHRGGLSRRYGHLGRR